MSVAVDMPMKCSFRDVDSGADHIDLAVAARILNEAGSREEAGPDKIVVSGGSVSIMQARSVVFLERGSVDIAWGEGEDVLGVVLVGVSECSTV